MLYLFLTTVNLQMMDVLGLSVSFFLRKSRNKCVIFNLESI